MSLQDQISAAIAQVNGTSGPSKATKRQNASGDGRGVSQVRNSNGYEVEVGDDEDDETGGEDQPQPKTNERGIRRELAAAIIGVAPASITGWIRRGRIQMTHDDFVPIREVRRMTIEVNLQKNRRRAPGDEDDTNQPDVQAKNRLESAKADIAEIELEVKRRNLVNRNAARKAFEEAAVVTKQRVLAVVDTVVADLQGKKDPNVMGTIIRKHLINTLITLSKGIRLSGESVTVAVEEATTAEVESGGES